MKKFIFIINIFYLLNIYSYDYPRPVANYYSQKGQDKFLNEKLFKNKENGFFVEVGAHDGISFSNTWYFEKNLGWTGICIEPNPEIFKQLLRNRSCYCEEVCITDRIGKMPFLKCSGYITEMYSGLINNFDPRHLERIDNEINLYGGAKQEIYVNCITFKELFQKYNISHIDVLSMDIEGGEEAAIKTIDFNEVKIDVIIIENNFFEDTIKNYLLSKGYLQISRLGKDDIYISKDFNIYN